MLTPLYQRYQAIHNTYSQYSIKTKQLHRDKTLINLLHMGVLLTPKWLQSMQKKINIHLHSDCLGHCTPLDFVTYFTYIFALPVSGLDLHQRNKRIQLLKLISTKQNDILNFTQQLSSADDLSPELEHHLQAVHAQEELSLKKTTLDTQRHYLQNTSNIGKIISATASISMQLLETIKVLPSLKIIALSSVTITAPFIFCNFVLMTALIDAFFAIKKLNLATKQYQAAKDCLITSQTLTAADFNENKSTLAAYQAMCQKYMEQCHNRVKKRQAKLIMRTTVVMTAVAILLPSFGVPFFFAALAGTISFSIYCVYYLYQKHNHKKKTNSNPTIIKNTGDLSIANSHPIDCKYNNSSSLKPASMRA